MTRVKRGVNTKKRHKKILKQTKGYRLLGNRVFSRAKNTLMKAGLNSYIGRKRKKRDFRKLWIIRINNAVREHKITYSKFTNKLYIKKVLINRKVLSNLSINNPKVFSKIVEFVK